MSVSNVKSVSILCGTEDDSRPKASLAEMLVGMRNSRNLSELNNQTIHLLRDLVNAVSVAIAIYDQESEQLNLMAGDQSIIDVVETHKIEFASQFASQKGAFYLDHVVCSQGSTALAVVPIGLRNEQAGEWFIAVEVGRSTAFAFALTLERLELVKSTYRTSDTARMLAGEASSMIELWHDIDQGLVTDDKLTSIVDDLCLKHDLPELVVAQVIGRKPNRIIFNKAGRPHSSSNALSDAKRAITQAIHAQKTMAQHQLDMVHVSGDWFVAVLTSNGSPAAVCAMRAGPVNIDGKNSDTPTVTPEEFLAIAKIHKVMLLRVFNGTALNYARRLLASTGFHRRIGVAFVTIALLCAFIPYPDRVEAPFRLVASETRVVTAPFDAVLETVNVKSDMHVSKNNTVLAQLSTREIDLSISRHVAKQAVAESKISAARVAQEPAKVKRARLEADIAKAEIEILRQRRTLAKIIPQISGVVTSAEIKNRVGTVVSRGQTLFEIANTDTLEIEIFVPDRRIVSVAAGQEGQLALAAQPGRHETFRVSGVHPISEAQTNRAVFRVDARFLKTADLGLRPGMEGVARIAIGTSTLGWLAVRDALNFIRGYFWI